MNKLVVTLSLVCITLITACESDQSTRLQDSLNTSAVRDAHVASFDPNNSVIPFPNNLLFSGTADGTLNIPVTDATDFSNPQVALNTLDGFSTITPISTSFSTAIDSSSLVPPALATPPLPVPVRVFQVTLVPGPIGTGPIGLVVSIDTELVFGDDFVATLSSLDTSNSTLVISPLKPLAESSNYFVVLTNGIKASDGKAFAADTTYALAKSTSPLIVMGESQVNALDDAQAAALEPLRQLTNFNEAAMIAFDVAVNRDDIILSWTFTTQSIGDVLTKVQSDVTINPVPTTSFDAATTNSPGSAATIYTGTLAVPYYLTAANMPQDVAPLNKFWLAAGDLFLAPPEDTPAPTNTALNVPLMVSIPIDDMVNPLTAKPVTGWKTVIFQHSITANRTSMLAVADTLAAAGFAVVAIDMPLHGITDDTSVYHKAGIERHFDLDLVDNSTSAPGPDGNVDSSGKHFINLSNLLVSRDNVRQSESDLFNLTKALGGMDYDMTAGVDFDLANIYFVGHSLGGIVGSTFLALEPSVKSAVLGMSAGGIAKVLDGSATFGPTIAAGLFQKGVVKGTADYESFMGAAQTVLDSGDPINYTAATASAGRGILLFEVVGGNSSPSDLVIPNTVPDSNDTANTIPGLLSGTDPIAKLMGLTKYTSDQSGMGVLKAWARFSAGDHSSLLSPANSVPVTTEMQKQMATFLASDGTVFTITDNTVIAPNL